MKNGVLILLLCAGLALAASGCGSGTAATSEPTQVPTSRPTEVATQAPTVVPTEPPPTAEPPTVEPTEEPAAAQPPASAALADTWIRPADDMVMVYVPAGQFEMGSNDPFYNNERPPHEVTLDGFWLDRTEVTNDQYRICVEVGACKPPSATHSIARSSYHGNQEYGDYPILFVNWYRAVAYCKWAGGQLPTEEQWEYAARGPESRWFPWGDMPDGTRLNYCDANCVLEHADQGSDDGYLDTAPVGSYEAGASWCGALDMVGNVWEWVWDWYGYYPAEENPAWLASDMKYRVVRGGAWDTDGDHARGSFRNWFDPAKSHDSIGFRCVITEPAVDSD